jgi:sulfur relay (sulfurtransferase) DsrF/TusC family protein
MSVGLIIMNNKIQLILADEGVFNLNVADHTKINGPEVTRHLQTLHEFGCEIIAEQESLTANKIKECTVTVCLKNKQEIAQMLTESNYVISI